MRRWELMKPEVDEWAEAGYMVSMLFYKGGQLETCGYDPPHFDEVKQLFVRYCSTSVAFDTLVNRDVLYDSGKNIVDAVMDSRLNGLVLDSHGFNSVEL